LKSIVSKKKELRLSVWNLTTLINTIIMITKKSSRTLTQTSLSNSSSLIANPDHIFLSPASLNNINNSSSNGTIEIFKYIFYFQYFNVHKINTLISEQ
jgi:hypothetical protein